MRPQREDSHYYGDISPRRQALDRAVVGALQLAQSVLGAHWLFLVNTTLGLYVGLALLAPVMLAAGAEEPGRALFAAYAIACHQLPERSFFLAGQQVAFCERDTAIYGAMFAAGLLYAGRRRRLRPLDWRWYVLACLPVALDGGTQQLGWRESTWELRVLTGVLFGVATVFFLYPHLEQTIDELRGEAGAAIGGRSPGE